MRAPKRIYWLHVEKGPDWNQGRRGRCAKRGGKYSNWVEVQRNRERLEKLGGIVTVYQSQEIEWEEVE